MTYPLPPVGTIVRCLLLTAAIGSAAALTVLSLLPILASPAVTVGPDGSPFTMLLVRACAAGLILCALWAVAATGSVLVEALTSGRVRTRGCPEPWRRTVLVLCGIAVVGAGPAYAGSPAASQGSPDWPLSPHSDRIGGLPIPDRPVGGPPSQSPRPQPDPADTGRPLRQGSTGEWLVVRSGDCLWSLAERLVPEADPFTVLRVTHRLYRANRAAVGSDPDLVPPGLRLRVPRLPRTVAPPADGSSR